MKSFLTRRSFLASSLSAAAVVVGGAILGKAESCFAAPRSAGKTLVVYYSKSGNTQAVAEMIQDKTHGDLYEIQTVKAYPRERPAAADIPKEERETGNLPELKGELPDLAAYDTVIIGSPIWWYTLATPVMTFLRDVDLHGKSVAGFYTYAGDGKNFEKDLCKQAKNARVLECIGFRGTYDTGRGPEPDGRAYQHRQEDEVGRQLDAWLKQVMRSV